MIYHPVLVAPTDLQASPPRGFKPDLRSILCAVLLALVIPPQAEARLASRSGADLPARAIAVRPGTTDNPALVDPSERGLAANASVDTTLLYSARFNSGTTCAPQGWTSVDITGDADNFWHVDDYAGLSFGPIAGSKSLWCGLRPGTDFLRCSYLFLPGYGNDWDQAWMTKTCLSVTGGPTINLDVSFSMRLDTEPSYDFVTLEYTHDCSGVTGWTVAAGGVTVWDGNKNIAVNTNYNTGTGPVRVRLRFQSDAYGSDQDGVTFDTNGAVHIDNLKVETLALEDFEGIAAGATETADWEAAGKERFGDYAGLFSGSALLQEDPCTTNLSCAWAFIQGSTETYACGGHPGQASVPTVNTNHDAINNEIWSPPITLGGSGAQITMEFDVYRDLPAENNLFYTWRARPIVNGCPTAWKGGSFYYGDGKDWFRHVAQIGSVLSTTGATEIQVALGVIDLCPLWCGPGSGDCHSHSPLFDNVKVYRVNVDGPQWDVRPEDLFQDTFSTDGTITGTARADAAKDIRPSTSPSIVPGDSALVFYLADPAYASGSQTNASGLSNDPNGSTFVGRHKTKKQVYLFVQVWPYDGIDNPGDKVGEDLSDGPGGQANRYPFAGLYTDANGRVWTKVRMDFTYTGTATNAGEGNNLDPLVPNRFNVDLNDNVFTPGDTVLFFFGATSPGGTTYYSDQWQPTTNIADVVANPMEFTILPAGGFNRGGSILYVDGADGLGNQPYFNGAFLVMGFSPFVDRYDVRAPSSAVGNRPAGRVADVAAQLNNAYGGDGILWDTGSLPVTLGDGTGAAEKTDDYALLNAFLSNLTDPGGLFLCGDDVAENLFTSPAPSAAAFRSSYMPFNLASGNHQASGFGVSPTIMPWPGRIFSDSFVAFGGCPEMNDFDVLNSSGTSLVQMSYNTAQSSNGAMVFNINGNARVLLCGLSFAYIRDNETNGISDRAKLLRDVISFVLGTAASSTDAGPMSSNALSQNFPNPFNPTTTIAFSIKARGLVTLNVYDVGGRLVRTLANETRNAGPHQLEWDGRDANGSPVASGVYFYRLVSGDFMQTRKMVLLK